MCNAPICLCVYMRMIACRETCECRLHVCRPSHPMWFTCMDVARDKRNTNTETTRCATAWRRVGTDRQTAWSRRQQPIGVEGVGGGPPRLLHAPAYTPRIHTLHSLLHSLLHTCPHPRTPNRCPAATQPHTHPAYSSINTWCQAEMPLCSTKYPSANHPCAPFHTPIQWPCSPKCTPLKPCSKSCWKPSVASWVRFGSDRYFEDDLTESRYWKCWE